MVPGPHGKGTTAMAENAQGSAKEERLRQRMAELGILEEDLVEKFVQGGGPGGQKINKTASCVCLHYEPAEGAAIDVKCQRTRSLALNRYYARWELCERLAERIEGERSLRQQEAEKIRRQKRRRSRRQKAKMLADKHHQSEKKAARRRVEQE
jgi:protein subunit release factor B